MAVFLSVLWLNCTETWQKYTGRNQHAENSVLWFVFPFSLYLSGLWSWPLFNWDKAGRIARKHQVPVSVPPPICEERLVHRVQLWSTKTLGCSCQGSHWCFRRRWNKALGHLENWAELLATVAFGRVIFRCSFWRRIVRGSFPVLQAPFAASWGRDVLRMEGGENMHQAGVKCQQAALWAKAPVWVEGVVPTWVPVGMLCSGCGCLTPLGHRRRSPVQIQPLCAPLLWLLQNRNFFSRKDGSENIL